MRMGSRIALGFIVSLSCFAGAPAEAAGTPPVPPKAHVRVLDCFAAPINISTWPDGKMEVVDANDRARYATDSPVEAKRLNKGPDGELGYRNERGYSVTIAVNGSRTVKIPELGVEIVERARDGKCQTQEFTIIETSLPDGRKLSGGWSRSALSQWRFVVDANGGAGAASESLDAPRGWRVLGRSFIGRPGGHALQG
jgi:hypothetical protein